MPRLNFPFTNIMKSRLNYLLHRGFLTASKRVLDGHNLIGEIICHYYNKIRLDTT